MRNVEIGCRETELSAFVESIHHLSDEGVRETEAPDCHLHFSLFQERADDRRRDAMTYAKKGFQLAVQLQDDYFINLNKINRAADVLFIDVEMPGQTGFEVLQSLRDEIPMELIVVFYSAFDKYMIDALRASAFDFLLKPYQQDEFELVVDRIRQKMKDGDDVDEDASSVPESSSCSSESVLASQKAQDFSGMNGMLGTAAKRLAIQTISGLLMLKPDDVFSCTFDEATHLWQLKLSNGQVYKLKRQATAKTILSMSPSLAQVRQDCIINLDYLLCIENYTLRCIFSPPFDHEEITVSRRCYKAVKDQLEIL